MAVELAYNIKDEDVRKAFRKFQKSRARFVLLALMDSMREVGLTAVGDFMEPRSFDFDTGGFGAKSTNKLGIRTSRLSRSILDAVEFATNPTGGTRESIRKIVVRNRSFLGRFGSKVPYARIHEEGGTIRPKSARVLTIPVTAQAQKAGSPRSFGGDLHFRFSGGRPLGLFDPVGKMQYVAKDSVTIPARPYLEPALKKSEKEIIRIFTKRMNELAADVSQ